MRRIYLTRGRVARVDDKDYHQLNRWNWYAIKGHSTYYAARRPGKLKGKLQKLLYMHTFIFGGNCDHKNHNGLDNRHKNLRRATKAQQSMNRRRQRNNTSGVKGVYWHKKSKAWMARIGVNSTMIYLGRFDDLQKAATVYNKAALKYHGEFAVLNRAEQIAKIKILESN